MKSPSSEISLLLVGFIFANFVVTSVANQPNKASFHELRDPPGKNYWSAACDISPDGSVVVGKRTLIISETPISLETACTMVIRGNKSRTGSTKASPRPPLNFQSILAYCGPAGLPERQYL